MTEVLISITAISAIILLYHVKQPHPFSFEARAKQHICSFEKSHGRLPTDVELCQALNTSYQVIKTKPGDKKRNFRYSAQECKYTYIPEKRRVWENK